ncbi:MAG: very short patch repair endonuclease [Gammaproteobacteria bacterium]
MCADVFTPEKRSWVMSRVRSSGNKSTELRFAGILRREKICGWRRKFPAFGKPDFVFPKEHVAVFIDGCFWHYCPRHGHFPATRRKYWRDKIARNRARDREVNRHLRRCGWKVLRFWGCELKDAARLCRKLRRLREMLFLL